MTTPDVLKVRALADSTPAPTAPIEPSPALIGQISLTLTALATIVSFIWHKDFTSIVPALGVLATAVIGAVLAIEHGLKYRTFTRAKLVYNDQLLNAHVSKAQIASMVPVGTVMNASQP